jgi:hypothetical protein
MYQESVVDPCSRLLSLTMNPPEPGEAAVRRRRRRRRRSGEKRL